MDVSHISGAQKPPCSQWLPCWEVQAENIVITENSTAQCCQRTEVSLAPENSKSMGKEKTEAGGMHPPPGEPQLTFIGKGQ